MIRPAPKPIPPRHVVNEDDFKENSRIPDLPHIPDAEYQPKFGLWRRLQLALQIVIKPDDNLTMYGQEKMEQKHDWRTTIAGFLPALLLIVADMEGLGESVRTYILAGGFILLGVLANNWGQLIQHLPKLVTQVSKDLSRKDENRTPTS